MEKKHEIVKRPYDGKYNVYSMIDDPDADLDYYRKSGLPIPRRWITIYVAFTEEEARLASRRSRI